MNYRELGMERLFICQRTRSRSASVCVAFCLIGFGVFLHGPCAASEPLTICEILERVQHRYAAADFAADFVQESHLEAMGMVDAAQGHVSFSPPAMMRWHYKRPEEYLIITDGQTVWVYRPAENQVMLGWAAEYFGDTKWTEFFTQPAALFEDFVVQWAPAKVQAEDRFVLKLLPKRRRPNLVEMVLSVSKTTFDIIQSVTCNAFGDKTTIRFENFRFNQGLDASLFRFKIPKDADVLQLDGNQGLPSEKPVR
jgi:outer membrane lipoprotein carrier protein